MFWQIVHISFLKAVTLFLTTICPGSVAVFCVVHTQFLFIILLFTLPSSVYLNCQWLCEYILPLSLSLTATQFICTYAYALTLKYIRRCVCMSVGWYYAKWVKPHSFLLSRLVSIERDTSCAFKLCCWELYNSVIVTAKIRRRKETRQQYIIEKNSSVAASATTHSDYAKEKFHSVRRFLSNCKY